MIQKKANRMFSALLSRALHINKARHIIIELLKLSILASFRVSSFWGHTTLQSQDRKYILFNDDIFTNLCIDNSSSIMGALWENTFILMFIDTKTSIQTAKL